MKFAIFVLFAVIAASQAHHHDKELTTECAYTQEDSMLSCHGAKRMVECEAKLLWDEPIDFSLFGISKFFDTVSLGLHYRLFPRALDNSVWLSNVDLSEDGVERYVSLHSQQNDENFGLNVADEACWSRLNVLFDESLRNETVFVETADSRTETFKVLGDLVVSKEYPVETAEMTKRWGYRRFGYGLGYYSRYYRWNRWNRYYPYSYYGWKRDTGRVIVDDLPKAVEKMMDTTQ